MKSVTRMEVVQVHFTNFHILKGTLLLLLFKSFIPQCEYYRNVLYLERCVGDFTTWSVGRNGSCKAYAPGEPNNLFCSSDCVDGLCAFQVCHECGICAKGTFNFTFRKYITLFVLHYFTFGGNSDVSVL